MRTGFILAVGGANIDIGARAETALRPGDSTPGRVGWSPGGVARNVAHNLACLGHAVRLITAVGDDAPGHALLAATAQARVDTSGCLVVHGERTASYVSVHDNDGRLTAAVNDMQVLQALTPAALAPHAALLGRAAALVLDCNLPEAALDSLFAHCGPTPVFVDAVSAFKCRRVQPWLARVHTLKVNRLEAQALSNMPVAAPGEIEAVADWLHRQGVAQVVVSLGADGLFHSTVEPGKAGGTGRQGPRRGWQAALPVRVLDTTGAGDALMAGLVHSHLHHEPPAQAVRFGAACAALTLTTPTANHPELSIARVEQLLSAHSAGTPGPE